jgi:hypothetical protein
MVISCINMTIVSAEFRSNGARRKESTILIHQSRALVSLTTLRQGFRTTVGSCLAFGYVLLSRKEEPCKTCIYWGTGAWFIFPPSTLLQPPPQLQSVHPFFGCAFQYLILFWYLLIRQQMRETSWDKGRLDAWWG